MYVRACSVSECVCVCALARARACVCVCVSLASESSETVEVIIVKLGKVTASDMSIHHVLNILTLTSIQGHTDQIMKIINV